MVSYLAMISQIWHQKHGQQKKKIDKLDLNELKKKNKTKTFFIEEHCWQSEKTTHVMGGYICKPYTC